MSDLIHKIEETRISPLDLFPQGDLREKIISLVIQGIPESIPARERNILEQLRQSILTLGVEETKVVVFGGGTGLSNIVGGDSRQPLWSKKPFSGLKAIFPETRSIVCVTDNGGSTGEILKELPLIAVGDMRHVLLSSVQLSNLQELYKVGTAGAQHMAEVLHQIFNYRFSIAKSSILDEFTVLKAKIRSLPDILAEYLGTLASLLTSDDRLKGISRSGNCFGNLLLVASIYLKLGPEATNNDLTAQPGILDQAIAEGMATLSDYMGCGERAVMPCTSTPAQLKVKYANGVEITGEHKLEKSRRGYPVEGVEVEYCGSVRVYSEVLQDISDADILVLAPGSLYSSIIPVLQVPGIADAVRNNTNALKVLIGNLWVQAGETDLSLADPERKFHLSDMIRAYEKNIPGGITGLFDEVLCIALKDIPGSILQNYAVEGKSPIYLDREQFDSGHYTPIECDVYSREALAYRGVIQHDPDMLALAVKSLYAVRNSQQKLIKAEHISDPGTRFYNTNATLPCFRFRQIQQKVHQLPLSSPSGNIDLNSERIKQTICDILWDHPIIPLCHLQYVTGISLIDPVHWSRDQRWDNVFSFFEPETGQVVIRGDQLSDRYSLETALMIAIGESLLGDYALKKEMQDVDVDNITLGRVYHLKVRPEADRCGFFSTGELHKYLNLARMVQVSDDHFTRLVNKGEGFTPPGLLMGLMYAWYVDNQLASHIEYKMSIMKINQTDLIPEQLRMSERRKMMIEFFKNVVFSDR